MNTLSRSMCFVAWVVIALQPQQALANDPHAYFNTLVSRSDHWKSYSLRAPAQLDHPKNGGYANANSGKLWVTYDPANDYHPQRQDAAKAEIVAMAQGTAILKYNINATQTFITLADSTGDVTKVPTGVNSKGRQLKLGNEILVATAWPSPCPPTNSTCYPLDRSTGVLHVTRGQYNTTATSHLAGISYSLANNSLQNQIRVPLGTADGNTYFFTWDTYYTTSYLDSGLTNHKAYQFDNNGIWFEPQTRFDGGAAPGAACFDKNIHVAGIEARAYSSPGGPAQWQSTGNFMGSITTNNQPIRPKIGDFCLHPGRWTRWFVLLEQRENDYDYMSMWMADEAQNAVQIYNRIPLNVKGTSNPPHSITKWWIELNTSTDKLGGSRAWDLRSLVSYHRNFVALINPPANISPFLVRPDPNVPLPPLPNPEPGTTQPAAPTNFRLGK